MYQNSNSINKKRVSNGLPWITVGIVLLVVTVAASFHPAVSNLLVGKVESKSKVSEIAPVDDASETIQQIEVRLRNEYDLRLKSDLANEIQKARAVEENMIKPPSPSDMLEMPRGIVADVSNLSNGIPLRTEVLYGAGETAMEEAQLHDSYTATYQLKMRVPRPAISILDIEKATPGLSKILPGFTELFPKGFVSPWQEVLYKNKITEIRKNSRQLNALLAKSTAYDCNTILHLSNEKGRKVFFMQADMDSALKGSDGDRVPIMPASQVDSIEYDPFTAYHWRKVGKAPNPMIAGWERRIAVGTKELNIQGITPAKKEWIEKRIAMLKSAIEAMKKRSYLISAYDPYIVLPLSVLKDAKDPYAPKVGDFAVMIHGRKIYPCIVGDVGSDIQVGEASARMALALAPQWNPAYKPVAYPGVSYLVFPGSREAETTQPDHRKWREKCLSLLREIGGSGDGYEVHDWTTPAPTEAKLVTPAKRVEPTSPPESNDKSKK